MNLEVHFDGPSVWQHCDNEKQQLERGLLFAAERCEVAEGSSTDGCWQKNISVKRINNAFL